MKRAGNLLDRIADPENLYTAFWKSARHKEQKEDVQNYREHLDRNIHLLQDQLYSGNLDIGNYHYFTIYDPKKRMICAAAFPERVLHHAIMNVCHDYFEKYQIYDSYETRINKGTHKALQRALFFHSRQDKYLKLDIHKYFDSINHRVLKAQLEMIFKDYRLLSLLYRIIDTYETLPGTGLPIGNLTSQYFANHYLAGFDHFVKEKMRIKSYVRYMDDMIIWFNKPFTGEKILTDVSEYISDHLNLSLNRSIQNNCNHGVTFLGYRLLTDHIELASKSKKRFVRKISTYEEFLNRGIWSQQDYQRHVTPMISYTEHASAKGFRRKIFANEG